MTFAQGTISTSPGWVPGDPGAVGAPDLLWVGFIVSVQGHFTGVSCATGHSAPVYSSDDGWTDLGGYYITNSGAWTAAIQGFAKQATAGLSHQGWTLVTGSGVAPYHQTGWCFVCSGVDPNMIEVNGANTNGWNTLYKSATIDPSTSDQWLLRSGRSPAPQTGNLAFNVLNMGRLSTETLDLVSGWSNLDRASSVDPCVPPGASSLWTDNLHRIQWKEVGASDDPALTITGWNGTEHNGAWVGYQFWPYTAVPPSGQRGWAAVIG